MSGLGAAALLAYERGLVSLVLATVVESTSALGRPPSRSFVAKVLAGSVGADMIACDAHRLSTFGMLKGTDVTALIDRLVAKGLLEFVRGRMGLVCTSHGRAILVEASTVFSGESLGIVVGVVNRDALDVAVRSGLVDALRRYRAERAAEMQATENRVFSEAELREISAERPIAWSGLQAIVGEFKAREFGAEVLRIVTEHLPIIERLQAVTS